MYKQVLETHLFGLWVRPNREEMGQKGSEWRLMKHEEHQTQYSYKEGKKGQRKKGSWFCQLMGNHEEANG